jgi:hypothetical protein
VSAENSRLQAPRREARHDRVRKRARAPLACACERPGMGPWPRASPRWSGAAARPSTGAYHRGAGAGRFRRLCRPPCVVAAGVRACAVGRVCSVPPGGTLVVERRRRGASDGCWFILGDITPVPGEA